MPVEWLWSALSSPVWIVTGILALLPAMYFVWKQTRYRRLIDKIPGFMDWPLVGDILHFETDPVEWYKQIGNLIDKNRKKKIMKLKMLETPWITLFTPHEIEAILGSSTHINKSIEYDLFHPWLGLGILTSTGAKWRSRRKMLTPSFHFKILQDFIPIINEHANNLKDKFLAKACDTDEIYNVFPDITLSSLDITCATSMGIHMDALNLGDSDYVRAIYKVKGALDLRFRNPFHRPDIIYNNIAAGKEFNHAMGATHQFTIKVIKDRRELKEGDAVGTKTKYQAFLDKLLDCRDENGEPLTDADVREEVDTIMFEGHDTTSSGIAFTIYLLGTNMEAQVKCQEELDAIFDTPREITSNDLSKMNYLEWCIKESMRLFPPVPMIGRQASEDVELAGYLVPKDTIINIYPFCLHRDPEIYPDPDKFDPLRFSPENCVDRHPYAYIPFSAGPRNCIGQKFAMMELKIIMATLLRSFKIACDQTVDELRVKAALINEPTGGIQVKLYSR